MGRTPAFDLKRDGKAMLREQWLVPGERLRGYVPVWKIVELDGIPKPAPTVDQVARKTLFVISRIPIYLLIAWLLALAGDAGGAGSSRRRPPVVIWGDGARSLAGRMVTSALRSRGIWVLTERRMAFLRIRGRTYSKLFSSDPEGGDKAEPLPPVPVEAVVEIPSTEWRYEGVVERTRRRRLTGRTRIVGRYHRIVFPDGSGLDVVAAQQR